MENDIEVKDILDTSSAFDDMPGKCHDLWWLFCYKAIKKDNYDVLSFPFDPSFCIFDDCQSPIEKIFFMAYEMKSRLDFRRGAYIYPQQTISINEKHYRVDFLFSSKLAGGEFRDMENPKFLVIECDGHEFHKVTKEQVIRDNERDLELKKAGYDVIHFSGSQIYRNSIKCAEETYLYIKKIMGVDD